MVNIAGNMYGMFPSMYNNQIAMGDYIGLDDYYSPMMGMNGSIFPMMPFMGGMNSDNYFQNYQQYQDFMTDSMVRQQENYRNAELRLNSPQEGISVRASFLHEKVMTNEQDQIQKAYADFKESVRNLYPNATEREISNIAPKYYKQVVGHSLIDDIREHGRDSFTQGLYQILSLGIADGKTKEENISEITGLEIGRSEKIKKVLGNATGGAIIGSGSAILLSSLWKIKSPILKALCKIPVLAGIGGVIASVLAYSNKD